MMPRSTIVVSPRERYSPTIESLKSLFASVPANVPVVVVDGAFPADLRSQLSELSRARPFRHETREWPLLPNQARNIGAELAETEFVVFSDNDILYEPGWLEALEAHADRTGVEVVAPLICIGPPRASVVHHAGGVLRVTADRQGVHLNEMHNLINRPIADVAKAGLPEVTDTGEFHCLFVRSDFLRRIGFLDERLTTREQNDFALRTRHAGGRVGFEPKAIVTYNAKTELQPGDLTYHVFRWNHDDAALSLDVFEKTWGVFLHRDRILKGWIQGHRRRRIVEQLEKLRDRVGNSFVKHFVAPIMERNILRKINRPTARRLPRHIPAEECRAVIAELAARTERELSARKARKAA
jgi:GT2 family glycosyltransferase